MSVVKQTSKVTMKAMNRNAHIICLNVLKVNPLIQTSQNGQTHFKNLEV